MKIACELHDFVRREALPETGVDDSAFWAAFSSIVHDLEPRNRELLKIREEMQEKIDHWHRGHGTLDNLVCDSNACFARATFSRVLPAVAVQTNGLGLALWASR